MNTYGIKNPFCITKANDFSDEEINEYWVNVNQNYNVLNTNDFMPKYILGGKGCGKTHLLRYFSYPLQKIRNKTLLDIIQQDKYIGIYSVLNGINSSRFKGKGIDDEQWKSAFEYYFELYICDLLLTFVKDLFKDNLINGYTEKQFINDTSSLFYDEVKGKNTIDELLIDLSDFRKKIDIEIVNAAFKRELDFCSMKILFSPGDLLFGIPSLLSKNVKLLKDFKFIFILDEYEKLFEWQKVFVNTLVWEKKQPCTFWIGARKYGYTTFKTKTEEEIKPGSEFQPIFLDDIFQLNEDIYKNFAKELYIKRLKKSFLNNLTSDQIYEQFSSKFEKYSDDTLVIELSKRFCGKEYRHIGELRKKIKEGLDAKIILPNFDIEIILESLIKGLDNNALQHKFKIYLLYREWSNWGTKFCKIKAGQKKSIVELTEIVDFVNKQYLQFVSQEPSEFDNIKEKYKSEFLAQLAKENNIKNTCYSGVDDFINLSWGNPRVFLLILKLVLEKSELLGEKPLEEGSRISLEAQYQGVYETAKWFYQDVEIVGDKGKNLYRSLKSISSIFQLYRFSDKPTETSVCAFNFGIESISDDAKEYINTAKTHSLIIEVKDRKQRNSGREELTYQMNKILTPLWNLPSSRRGVADFNSELIESIFNPEKFHTFESKYVEMKSRYTAPFLSKSKLQNKDLGTLEMFPKL